MKFGDLITRKIIKFVATKCQILRLKSKFNFGRGSAQISLVEFTGLPKPSNLVGLLLRDWREEKGLEMGF